MHGGGSLKRVIYKKRNFSLALWLHAFNRIKENSKTTLSSALYMFSLPWKRNYQQHLKVERQKVSKANGIRNQKLLIKSDETPSYTFSVKHKNVGIGSPSSHVSRGA